MSFLICSSERAVRKHAGETPKDFLPHAAKPAVMPTRFCSAMPTSTSCFGKAWPNGPSLPEPRESLVTRRGLDSPWPVPSAWRQIHQDWRGPFLGRALDLKSVVEGKSVDLPSQLRGHTQ